MPIKICLAGATGKVGQALVSEILKAKDLKLVGATSRSHSNKALSSINPLYQGPVILKSSALEAFVPVPHVLIDYTNARIVKDNVITALNHKIHVVIGSSGLTDADYNEIDARARKADVGVFAAGNFSLTSTLMQHFSLIAARYLSYWEIIDFGTEKKADAPSGTSRELAHELQTIRKPIMEVSLKDIHGSPESRGATINGSQVHSIRLPSYYSSSEIIFGGEGERLSIRHDSFSALPYVAGTLLAVRKVQSFVGLKRGLATLLDL